MISAESTVGPTEEEKLDRVMTSMDPFLKESLQRDQRKRHLRFLVFGGLFMLLGLSLVGAVFAGSFLLAGDDRKVDEAVDSAELTQKGYKLWQSGNHVEAVKKFERAIKIDPENSSAWNGLGWAKFNQGFADDGLEAFEKCVILAPNNVAALNGIGQISIAKGDLERAEKALFLAKQAPAAWFGLLKLHLLKGDFEEAEKWWKKLQSQGAVKNLFGADKIQAAIEAKQLSAELKKMFSPFAPQSKVDGADALLQKARQLAARGQFRPARLAFEAALEKDPEFTDAKIGLAYTLTSEGSLDKAKELFEQLAKEEADKATITNGLAIIYRRQGEFAKAIELWKQLEKIKGGELSAYASLGSLYYELNKYDLAIPYLEKVLEITPENKFLVDMLDKARAAKNSDATASNASEQD